MAYATLSVGVRAPIAELRLRAGADIAALLDDIDRAASRMHDDASVHVVLLTGEAGAWSIDGARSAHGGTERLPFRSLELMGQPAIACIEGACRDAGLGLALACDVRIAAADATFAAAGLSRGAPTALGLTQRLPRAIGRTHAAEMLLLGERFDAERALACGLVNAVEPPLQLRASAERLAVRIAAQGPLATRYAKEAISRGLDMPLDQALRYETDLTVILQTTTDRAEGVAAFVGKRPPRFEGR